MGDPSKIVHLPSGELLPVDPIARAVEAGVREAFKLWTEQPAVEPPTVPRSAKRPTLTIVLTTVIVLLLGWTAYREYASYADKEAETEDRILSALDQIQADQRTMHQNQSAMQGKINDLYKRVLGDKAQPQTVEPLVDAISHGSGASN